MASVYAAQGNTGSNMAAAGGNASQVQQNMRMGVASQVVMRPVVNAKPNIWATSCWCLPQVIAGIVVLATNWETGEFCNQPLRVFCIANMARLTLHMVAVFFLSLESSGDPSNMGATGRKAHMLKRFLDGIGGIWMVFSCVLVFRSDCQALAPAISKLSLAYTIIMIIFYSLPCVLCCLCLPLMCCALPLVMRLSRQAHLIPNTGASQTTLEQLPVTTFRAAEANGDVTCCICLADYTEGEELRVLPCGGNHHFHKQCVDDWLHINATCPQCRGPVVDANGHVRQPDAEAGQAGANAGVAVQPSPAIAAGGATPATVPIVVQPAPTAPSTAGDSTTTAVVDL